MLWLCLELSDIEYEIGTTPHAYLVQHRVRLARRLLGLQAGLQLMPRFWRASPTRAT
jgi:hypothetical protein